MPKYYRGSLAKQDPEHSPETEEFKKKIVSVANLRIFREVETEVVLKVMKGWGEGL